MTHSGRQSSRGARRYARFFMQIIESVMQGYAIAAELVHEGFDGCKAELRRAVLCRPGAAVLPIPGLKTQA